MPSTWSAATVVAASSAGPPASTSPGWDPTTSFMIAESRWDGAPVFGLHQDSAGTHALNRREEGEPIRVLITERSLEHAGDPDLNELREALVAVYGTDYGLRSASWISRFTDMTRQAASYREGRVLLAGDAAHVHAPNGGQGLNVGVQDAVNLGWKLAQVVHRTSPEALLDTYHAERHPVAARVLRTTMAQVALRLPDERHEALRETMAELLDMEEPRVRIAAFALGSRRPLRPRGGTSTPRATHARPRPADRAGADHGVQRCCTTPCRYS